MDDGSVIDTASVEYGTVPTHADATKAADAQYTYTFTGWDTAPVAVTKDATYTATFDKTVNKYTVTWKNDDGSVIDTATVEYGTVPTHADASKAADVQYTYTFKAWTPAVEAVTKDVTYTASYENTLNKYTITFKNGTEVLQTSEVEYGKQPVYTGATPTKAPTATEKYKFDGWTVEEMAAPSSAASLMANEVYTAETLPTVSGAKTYQAHFKALPIDAPDTYTINFRYANEAGELVDHKQDVEEGKMPEIPTPAEYTDGNTTYTFDSWDKEVVAATGDAVYTAVYKANTKFTPDTSEFDALVNRYNQMVKTGLYNKDDLKAVKAFIDDVYDKLNNDAYTSQDDFDTEMIDLTAVEDAVRKIETPDEPQDDDDDNTNTDKPGRRTSPATGDNASLVVMSVILVSAIGLAVLSLKKKRENI